jgi:hypothetical protein
MKPIFTLSLIHCALILALSGCDRSTPSGDAAELEAHHARNRHELPLDLGKPKEIVLNDLEARVTPRAASSAPPVDVAEQQERDRQGRAAAVAKAEAVRAASNAREARLQAYQDRIDVIDKALRGLSSKREDKLNELKQEREAIVNERDQFVRQ